MKSCCKCRATENITKHHIVARCWTGTMHKLGLRWNIRNCVDICRKCHDKYEKVALKVHDGWLKTTGLYDEFILANLWNGVIGNLIHNTSHVGYTYKKMNEIQQKIKMPIEWYNFVHAEEIYKACVIKLNNNNQLDELINSYRDSLNNWLSQRKNLS